jgi:uncharacterized phage-associated protein
LSLIDKIVRVSKNRKTIIILTKLVKRQKVSKSLRTLKNITHMEGAWFEAWEKNKRNFTLMVS